MNVAPACPRPSSTPDPTSDVDIVSPCTTRNDSWPPASPPCAAISTRSFPFTATVTIADNASTDGTWRIATQLTATLEGVAAIHLDREGPGRALRAAWSRSTASVVAYMDVDLATGLDALLPLVAPLLSGHSDVAIGTRLGPGAHVVRGARREFISRGYNLLLRVALRSECTDAQCGFKAMRREAAFELLPLVQDNEWFFDTEVLVTAQRIGLRIHEVPVDWVDDQDSRVDVLHTALEDLRGVMAAAGSVHPAPGRPSPGPAGPVRPPRPGHRAVGADPTARTDGRPDPVPWRTVGIHDEARLRSSADPSAAPLALDGAPSQVFADELLRFAGVGAASTVAYAALFAALEPALGSYLANGVAIGLCSLGNTAAHRGMAGPARRGLDRRRASAHLHRPLRGQLGLYHGSTGRHPGPRLDQPAPELVRGDRGQRRCGRHPVRHLAHLGVPSRVRDPTVASRPGTPDRRTPQPAPMGAGCLVTDINLGGRHRRRARPAVTTGLDHPRPGPSPGASLRTPPGGGGRTTDREAMSDGPVGPPEPSRRRPAPPVGGCPRLVRGRPEDPAWVRPALVALLVGTGFLYIWGLGQSGWANSFYSAAVQAGTKSWKAFFFGSFDASNFITVDKPPASLWVMEISARLFGVNAWSILVPQALEGVATVGLLFVTVRRWFPPGRPCWPAPCWPSPRWPPSCSATTTPTPCSPWC